MAVTTHSPEARIDVASDATEARLIVPADFDRVRLTADHCLELLESAGVELTEYVRQTVGEVVNELRQGPSDGPVEKVLAQAEPALPGQDGSVQWHVERPSKPPAADPEAGVSHYDRSAFILVETGDVLGQVHEPTEGRHGRDVTGQTLPAQDGKPVELQLDGSIEQDDTGRLIAQVAGVLVRHGQQASIQQLLEIDKDVDFSTGHIDFKGDVIVKGGVRDRFRIRTTGNVDVHGLIEAATIEAKGDLNARGGFAGREHGNVHLGGDLHARYLDNIHGTVHGSLFVEREIINCELTVHGKVDAERGAIIGGRVGATGSVNVSLLGSRAGTTTELILGRVPSLEPLAQSLNKRIRAIDSRQSTFEKEMQQFDQVGRGQGGTAVQRRRAELEAELNRLRAVRQKGAQVLKNLRQAIEERRTVDLTVEKRISPGVVLVIGHQRFHLHEELRGPVHIRRNRNGQVIYQRTGNEPTPLAMIAELVG